ncbi:MAG: hypothetical protein Pars2KO_24250 [Parasphingorhabdus sp.]
MSEVDSAQSDAGIKITGLQWFFLRSKNPVYFAIHIPRVITAAKFYELVNWVLTEIPSLSSIYDRNTETFRSDCSVKVAQTCEYHKVEDLSACWNQFLGELPLLFDNLDGRLFRATCFVSSDDADETDASGESLVMFAALHAVIEGVDLANVLRGKFESGESRQLGPAKLLSRTSARNAFYALTGILIVVSSHILARARRRPSIFPAVQHISLERQGLRNLAREYGVSQKALLFALVRHSLNQIEPQTNRLGWGRRVSLTYTEHAQATQSQDDEAIKMRLRSGLLDVRGNIKDLAEKFDAMFSRKHKKPHVFQRTNNAAIRINRILEKIFPKLYGEQMFDYLPFSECYTLLPPNRFRANLSEMSDGTLLTGSMSRGLDVITFCPSRKRIHIAFKTEPARARVTEICLDTLKQLGLSADQTALEF